MTTKCYLIRSGPSASRLWDSAKYTFDKNDGQIPVRFTIENGTVRMMVTAMILGVTHTDGSGNEFKIIGHIYQLTGSLVTMFYRADRAGGETKGHLEFEN